MFRVYVNSRSHKPNLRPACWGILLFVQMEGNLNFYQNVPNLRRWHRARDPYKTQEDADWSHRGKVPPSLVGTNRPSIILGSS